MRLYILALIALVFVGCSDDILKDEATVQGLINNDFYKAVSATASINETGELSIRSSSTVLISFKTESVNLGTYIVTENGPNTATYEDFNGVIYTSAHADVVGEITITQVDEDGFDGTFFFNLKNADGEEVFIRSGSFFNVPLLADGLEEPQDPADPTSNFLNASVNGTNFEATTVNLEQMDGVNTLFGMVDGAIITVVFPDTLEAGTYDVSTEMAIQLGYTESDTVEFAESGTLVITEITDTTISGTFEFTTASSIQVTAGEFLVNL